MNSPCLSPSFRSEAFAEDLDPPTPAAPARWPFALLLLAGVPLVLALLSGAAVVLVSLS
jgi:hypothetical protein